MRVDPIIKYNFREAGKLLDEFILLPGALERIEEAAMLMSESLRCGGKIIACGNGGSLCDATHFAEELTGRFRLDRHPLAAIAINDPAYITCVANDYSYEEVFSRFVEAVGTEKDVLLAISTSGKSNNVVKAACKAKEMGMKIIALTGRAGELSCNCDIEIRTPETAFSDRVQEIHIKVIHTLVQLIEKNVI